MHGQMLTMDEKRAEGGPVKTTDPVTNETCKTLSIPGFDEVKTVCGTDEEWQKLEERLVLYQGMECRDIRVPGTNALERYCGTEKEWKEYGRRLVLLKPGQICMELPQILLTGEISLLPAAATTRYCSTQMSWIRYRRMMPREERLARNRAPINQPFGSSNDVSSVPAFSPNDYGWAIGNPDANAATRNAIAAERGLMQY